MISPIQQYLHADDGSIRLKSAPEITIDTIAEQGHVKARDLQKELGVPMYREEWEALAKHTGFSSRTIRFVAVDASPSRLPGHPVFQPERIVPTTCYLEFAHYGFIVGQVNTFFFVHKDSRATMRTIGVEVPEYVQGDCLIAEARLFDSPLADKAWWAIQNGIFSHTCPVIYRQQDQPVCTGQLVEVSLTTGDFPGCANARIMNVWD